MEGLQNYDVWFTGLRREQSPTRKNLKTVEHHALPSGKVLLEGQSRWPRGRGSRSGITPSKTKSNICRFMIADT